MVEQELNLTRRRLIEQGRADASFIDTVRCSRTALVSQSVSQKDMLVKLVV